MHGKSYYLVLKKVSKSLNNGKDMHSRISVEQNRETKNVLLRI